MSKEIKAPEAVITASKSWDGKHELIFNESSHRYKLDGRSVVGTTTFIKSSYPTSIGLINWMKHQTSIALFERLTQEHFANTWPTDENKKKEIFKIAESAHEGIAQEAADCGTVLHGFSELHSLGKISEANTLLNQVREADKWPIIEGCVTKYLEWDLQNKGKLILAEALIASPIHLFCGKIDRLDEVQSSLILRDYKTSKAIFLEHKIQLAAYRLAIREWLNLNIDAIEILRFGKTDGSFETELISDKKELNDLEQQVIRLRQTYEFMRAYGK